MYEMYEPNPNPTIRLSLAFGVSAGILDSLGNFFLAAHLHVSDSTQAALSLVGFAAILAGPFVSALMTSRELATIKSGMLAGLLTGVVGSLTSGTATVVAVAIDPNAFTQAAGVSIPGPLQQVYNQFLMGGLLGSVCCGAILWAVFGAGLGALGGLIGNALEHSGGTDPYPANPYEGMAPPPGPYPPGAYSPGGYPGYQNPPELAPDKPPPPYMPGAGPQGPPPAPWPPRPGTAGPPPVGYGPPPPGGYGPPPAYPPRPGTSGPAPMQSPFPPPQPPYGDGG